MTEISAGLSSTSCWTCRRRRVKCDRRLPECQKCSISGEPCQGYSAVKPLRWTNGVASRGKLMGKSLPTTGANAPIAMLLVDPVLQDLCPTNQHYIKYFDQYCSVESVLYGSNATNPFREFMRLIPSSPALLHTIISIAALHQAWRTTDGRSVDFQQLLGMGNGAVPMELDRANITSDQSSAIYDALKHKQLALRYMQKELLNSDLGNIDGTIASMLLLVWQDLMDSGQDSWKFHLDGLKGIVQARICSPKRQNSRTQGVEFSTLHEHFEMTYAAFQILGTTFIPAKQSYNPLFSSRPTAQIMKVSENQTWAGCPAELLYIISLLNNVSKSQPLASDLKTHIFSVLEDFSPMKWAIASTSPGLMKARYHLASAYKGAVVIYMSQVVHELHGSHNYGSLAAPLDSIIVHLESISHTDAHFKSLVWPTFVIGAEARHTSQRMVISQVFERLWAIWRCQNVRNALNVLQDLWVRTDEKGSSGLWIDDVYRWGMDWIFV
ncbi:fungal-specific transcription factor domain-containing protein [Penicillium hispanicum]|uniref:fungal-specific transcription factor domain-containing protein n=1 Tax=Penicillium hispanicum TaxID=1080232 RepID=UPI0025407F11|nr:fungal-specific transcription factor domain-containing protein [Penicillium hispanicum]KAJ5595246.1 fungal-specific transcription factor domain-containing protein [Penicillium hispanicum]